MRVHYNTNYCQGSIVKNETIFFNTQACQSGTSFTCSLQEPPESILGIESIVVRFNYYLYIIFIISLVIYSTYALNVKDSTTVTTECDGPIGAYTVLRPSTCFYGPFSIPGVYYGKATLNLQSMKNILFIYISLFYITFTRSLHN